MSMPLGSYAHWQLAWPSTPKAELTDLVGRAVGSEIVRTERIIQGYSNEVYRVLCADEQDLIVRILRFDEDVTSSASAGEAEAIEMARIAGVPAPEVLLLDTVRIDGSEFPAMVQRTVSGRPVAEVIGRLSERQRYDLLVEIGELIARLNGVSVDSQLDWSTAMASELADRHHQRDSILAAGFSSAQFDRMLDLLEAYVRDFSCEEWVLCHGDLSLKHIFVVGGGATAVRVSGIIDFGDWKPGAPVHDLAVLRAREPQLDLPPLLAGCGAPRDQAYRRRLDLHTLMIALGSLAIGVDENDQACIARCGHQISTLVCDLGDR